MKCSKEHETKARIVVECLRSNQVANSTLSREGVTNISFHAWSISQAQFRMSHTVRSVGQPRLKPSGLSGRSKSPSRLVIDK